MKCYIGIDPGWVDLAFAVIDVDGAVLHTGVLDPSTMKGARTSYNIEEVLSEIGVLEVGGLSMERYVTYDGKSNPRSENILMVTGQLQFWSTDRFEVTPIMWRAIDWKSRLSKHLFKQGFKNPSDRLDKKFSIAAAEFIFQQDFETDHEADAACMAYIARMLDRD